MYVCGSARVIALVLFSALVGRGVVAQTTVTFNGTSAVDLGTNLDKLADLPRWEYTLGTEWDEDFKVGGIIGSPNTTIIPEVKVLGEVIIPQVKADTRTGAQMQGRIWGDTGLELSVDFVASGLEPGVGFSFAPTLTHDTTPEAGSFFKFDTTTGVLSNPGYTEEALELPSVDAQIDFFFNLDIDSTIDYGLFPFVPYNSVPFAPGGIHLDQRDDADKSLLRFQASFDPDDNGGNPLPPTFTAFEGVEVLGIPLEQQIGQLDDGEFLASKQFSTNVKDKNNPDGPKPRIDLGEIQVVNPFGTGGDLLGTGTGRNLEIATSIEDDTIGYTAETPLFRLGLDLDGIAAGLATGQSFTRIEEDIKINDTKIAEIVADLIDLKYGPEVGFRESVEINPEFKVTLDFLDGNGSPVDVAINDNGSVSLMSTFDGDWNDLPEIALLTADPVDVQVTFNSLVGDQSKRGVFYLTDYLEFTLLELESLNILDEFEFSLPPLLRTRTSLLGDLLGELELEAYADSADIAPIPLAGEVPTQSFTITPAPSVLAYLSTGGSYDPLDLSRLTKLDDGQTPTSLPMTTIVIGQGDPTAQSVADLTPLDVTDSGSGTVTSWGLRIVEGSSYTQNGSRVWSLPTFTNDGTFNANGSTTIQNGGTLVFSGGGELNFNGPARVSSTVGIQLAGHTINFNDAQAVSGTRLIDNSNLFINAGTINAHNTTGEFFAGMEFENTATGQIAVTADAGPTEVLTVSTPEFTNNGVVTVGPGARLDLKHPTPNFFQTLRGDGTYRVDGGTLNFTDGGIAYAPDNATAPDARSHTFEVVNGGTLDFQEDVRFLAKPTFTIDATSTAIFNGLTLDGASPGESRFGPGAPIDVVNEGTLIFNSGSNSFRLSQLVFAGQEPEVIPIGLDNRGTVSIRWDGSGFVPTRLNLDAELRDYAEGGATFNAGTWEIIGPTPTGLFNNRTSGDSAARINLEVSQVEVGDNYLTVINPGQPGGDIGGFSDSYDATDYDTFMSTNRSDITLSGRALFQYLNTVATNHGTLRFDNKNHFITAGDLTNTGSLIVTNGGRIDVTGDLIVDGGTVIVDVNSGITVNGNTIEVIGGTVLVDRSNFSSVTVNSPWIVRERTEVDDQGNVTAIIPGIVDYGTVWEHIDSQGDITAAGSTTEFRPLVGLSSNGGKLTLDAGYQLTLDQGLANHGELNVLGGANLLVNGNFTNSGQVYVGAESYMRVAGIYDDFGGDVMVDGVLEIDVLDVDEFVMITGSGRITGDLDSRGTTAPGNSAGILRTFGTYTQQSGADSELIVELFGPDAGDDHDQVRAKAAILGGTLNLIASPDVIDTAYGKRLDIVLTDNGISGHFDTVTGLEIDANHAFALFYEPDRVSVVAALKGDANFSGRVEQGDLDAVLSNWGDTDTDWLGGDLNGDGSVEQGDLDAVLGGWGLDDIFWMTGDLNASGLVEQGDLDAVLSNWGLSDRVWFGAGDINGNGLVEQGDLDIILANWGSAAAPDFRGLDVPEPTGLIVLLGCMLGRRPASGAAAA